ncbi:nitrous oxide reductase family maturation protein NosD [Bacillus sp. FJAT-27445]|uniref:nitrous oxide reductase family maturation protein NosD n=1 Tax=Bacillus sp. FJAT-27445 TaxID=1679166 RepID=UPI0007440709|nr:nitrous oxide reductase family maturation protein NosD [Bacillus sp. FJAT-27445]
MMKKLFFLSLFFLLIAVGPEKTAAAEDLQNRINSMKDGETLFLKGKTYLGNLVITKSIKIFGTKGTVIKGDGKGNVISVKAPGVTIANLTVNNGGMDRNAPEEYAAIKVFTNDNKIENVKIGHAFHGIYLSKAYGNVLKNNKILGTGGNEIAAQGNGIHVYYSNKNTIKGNTIEGTRDGMYFDYSNQNKIVGNKISHTRYGLHYMYSHNNSLSENIFTFNTGGAAIMESDDIKLKKNQFIFNYGNRSFGILLQQTNDIVIENNIFYLNQRGIYSDQANRTMIIGNQITQNQIGIELWASSSGQVFTENTVSENTIPAVALGGQGANNQWSLKDKGNYWGKTLPLPDLDQDGKGDFPITYRSSLFQLLEDQELSFLFLKSPALKIYEKLNSLLNGDEIMFTDAHPLISTSPDNRNRLWMFGAAAFFAALLLLFKGRHQLCIIFGKNGRKP